MSFKREGDDKGLLGILRQRRIKDLLAVNIPENEAVLTSNGRLSCTVCYHRPIFDTVEMLLVHRQGKKHAAGVQYKKQEKKEIQELILKRKHEQYLKDGTTNIKQATEQSESKIFCLGQAYDPRVKKNKPKQPKVKLDLNNSNKSYVPMATVEEQLPGNRDGFLGNSCQSNQYIRNGDQLSKQREVNTDKVLEKSGNTNHHGNKKKFSSKDNSDCVESTFNAMIKKQMDGPVLHSHQLKSIFEIPRNDPVHITPYQSKKVKVKPQGTVMLNHVAVTPTILSADVSEDFKIQVKTYPDCEKTQTTFDISTKTMKESKAKSKSECVQHHKQTSSTSSSKDLKQSCVIVNQDVEAQKEKAEKYLHYRGAGWKKDLFGNWVKDEDAEFDSDDEPPDLL